MPAATSRHPLVPIHGVLIVIRHGQKGVKEIFRRFHQSQHAALSALSMSMSCFGLPEQATGGYCTTVFSTVRKYSIYVIYLTA